MRRSRRSGHRVSPTCAAKAARPCMRTNLHPFAATLARRFRASLRRFVTDSVTHSAADAAAPRVSAEFSANLPADIFAPVGNDLHGVTTRP